MLKLSEICCKNSENLSEKMDTLNPYGGNNVSGLGPCSPHDAKQAVLVKGSWEKVGPLLDRSHDTEAIKAAH